MLRLLVCLAGLLFVLSACDSGKTKQASNADVNEVKQEIAELLQSQDEESGDDLDKQDGKVVDQVLAHSAAEAELGGLGNDSDIGGEAVKPEVDGEMEVDMD